jgi:hypothetical protein
MPRFAEPRRKEGKAMASTKRLHSFTVSAVATLGLVQGLLMFCMESAHAAPIDSPQAVVVQADCEGLGTVLVLHPGIGKPMWDVSSAEVTGGPDYMIKSIDEDVYMNGDFIGSFTYSFGNRVGQGESIRCTFYETFIDDGGNLIEVYGVAENTVK